MPSKEETFTTLAAGMLHTCGVRTDGGISCWGDNQKSQLQLDKNRRYSFSVGALKMTLP